MHYLGSKARHAKDITAITLAERRPDQIYVEPFVGGGNIINIVPQGAGRIANDLNRHMVALLKAAGEGWLPPERMTQTQWNKIRKDPKGFELKPFGVDEAHRDALIAFAATGPTFGSMWMGEWAKDYEGKEGTRYRQARDAVARDAAGLAGIEFHSGSFLDLVIPDGSLVYCDPPYSGTTGYAGATQKIKVGEALSKNTWKAGTFWRWADDLIDKKGCRVFVSEYKGPDASMYKDVVPSTSEELVALRAEYDVLKRKPAAETSNEMFDELGRRFQAEQRRRTEPATKMAERWKSVWHKEVVSDFSASRGKEKGDGHVSEAKVEYEHLFTRE